MSKHLRGLFAKIPACLTSVPDLNPTLAFIIPYITTLVCSMPEKIESEFWSGSFSLASGKRINFLRTLHILKPYLSPNIRFSWPCTSGNLSHRKKSTFREGR